MVEARSVWRAIVAKRLTAMLAIAVASVAPDMAKAQAALTGTVTDTSGVPILGARVTVDSTSIAAQSDERGQFRLRNLPFGRSSVSVVRLGFQQSHVIVQIENGVDAELHVRMIALAAPLPPIVVNPGRVKYTGRLAGYYKRLESRSAGYFITRADIDSENHATTGQLLARLPAIQVLRGRGGITSIRMRQRKCWPLVWIDGMPMPTGEVDLDAFVPSSIQGIEVYLGATSAPMAYVLNESLNSCGTILIWSRGPDTDPVHSVAQRAGDFASLISSNEVYTSQNVDRGAHLDSTQILNLTFPPSLFASKTAGLVVAEFVVNTLGHVEGNTLGIVSSTSPLFTESVRVALETAAFVPAVKNGKLVRQIVQQPFEFSLEKGSLQRAALRQQ